MVRIVKPQVFLIGETTVNINAMNALFEGLGPEAALWFRKPREAYREKEKEGHTGTAVFEYSDGERLCEIAGRLCYKSFGTELNPNLTMVRDNPLAYFKNLIEKGDGSVLEHSSVTFAFLNVSRVFTHELVRHRVGAAYSQESLRFVRLDHFRISELDPILQERPDLNETILAAFDAIEEEYLHAYKQMGWEAMEKDFNLKKRMTSLIRRLIPHGLATDIVATFNHRTLRWLLEARTNPGAEIEIRTVFGKVGEILLQSYPLFYQDFETKKLDDGTTQYIPTLRSKV